jgi:hypothetical protein
MQAATGIHDMTRNTTLNVKLLAALISGAFALTACGGGGGGAATPPITGTAATGMPLAGATISAYSTTGQCGSATTGALGQFSIDVSKCSGNLILGIQAGTNSNPYYSMVTASEVASGATVNVTPWTTAILNGVLGTNLSPLQMATALNNNAANVQQVETADSGLEQTLNALNVPGLSNFDPMHGAFTANGSGFDAVLDSTTINNSTIVVATGNGTTQSVTIGTDGNVSSPTESSVPPTGSEQNASYLDINALQPVDGSTTTVNATDSATQNANGNGGNQDFPATPIGTTGTSTPNFYTTVPDALSLDYSWGGAYFVDSYSSNPQNPYMGGVEMVCEQTPGNGISGTALSTSGIGPQSGTYTNLKSTDVLVTSQATPLTTASALAGLSFPIFYEDCSQGDTLPATVNTTSTIYNELQFDSQGNLTATTTNGATTAPQTFTLSASQVTNMLNGQPQTTATSTSGVNSYVTFNAYTFTSAYGMKKTVIVEHGGAGTSANSLSRGYVALWATGN